MLRSDLNEEKAASAGRFWHDVYANLIRCLAKAGCWDGMNGHIYPTLFKMLYAREAGHFEHAMMQFPFAFACHKGEIDDFACPEGAHSRRFPGSRCRAAPAQIPRDRSAYRRRGLPWRKCSFTPNVQKHFSSRRALFVDLYPGPRLFSR